MAQNGPKMAEGGVVGAKGSGWVAHAERDGEALGPHPTPFGHFGPVLGHLGPFGHFGSFWAILAIWGHFGHFGQFWAILGIFGHFVPFWSFG